MSAAVLDICVDALKGMLGLTELLRRRADCPADIAMHLEQNHRVRDARTALELASGKSAWMPTESGLPDDDITVLVALDDGEVWPAYRDGEQWLYVTGDAIESARVLYWMPMPPHPDEEEAA